MSHTYTSRPLTGLVERNNFFLPVGTPVCVRACACMCTHMCRICMHMDAEVDARCLPFSLANLRCEPGALHESGAQQLTGC